MKILITGCAGFIGFHLAARLIEVKKYKVVGIDNINTYYDVDLKKNRLKLLKKNIDNFSFIKTDIIDKQSLEKIFKKYRFDIVINLAAQAGVRFSIKNPKTYVDTNLIGFFNILDLSKDFKVKHLLFASSSSVYGNNTKFPWRETTNTDSPLSFYAATKKCNEIMAHAYNNIYKLKCTGLRFFTVYGEWGRPDMALYKFTHLMVNNKTINLYNYGKNIRDFTHVRDIVDSIIKLINKKNYKKPTFEILNLGSNRPIKIIKIIKLLEKNLNIKSKIKFVKEEIGDAKKTYCDSSKLSRSIKYEFKNNIDSGVKEFVAWYLSYHKKNKLNHGRKNNLILP